MNYLVSSQHTSTDHAFVTPIRITTTTPEQAAQERLDAICIKEGVKRILVVEERHLYHGQNKPVGNAWVFKVEPPPAPTYKVVPA